MIAAVITFCFYCDLRISLFCYLLVSVLRVSAQSLWHEDSNAIINLLIFISVLAGVVIITSGLIVYVTSL